MANKNGRRRTATPPRPVIADPLPRNQAVSIQIASPQNFSPPDDKIDLSVSVPDKSWEAAKLEYDNALQQLRHYSSLGRTDVAFITTVQGAALTIIGKDLLNLDSTGIVLSILAFFCVVLGLNSQRRLWNYMTGYVKRASTIELKYGMSLLQDGKMEVESQKYLFSNNILFLIYHWIILLSWVTIWILNVWK